MRKNYVSNSEESIRMFRSNFLELLSKVHFTIPIIIYLPIITFLIYRSWLGKIGSINILIFFLIGLFIWTITEYTLHRFVFHFVPKSKWGLRLHFIFHGVHHDYPKDRLRLVMPPAASILIALIFLALFSLFLKGPFLFAFFAGFLLGYLIYDISHYAIHHFNFKNNLFVKIKEHHMMHHYFDPTKGFGVSSSLWDNILNSNFPDHSTKQ